VALLFLAVKILPFIELFLQFPVYAVPDIAGTVVVAVEAAPGK
jgi:hypothetical protein